MSDWPAEWFAELDSTNEEARRRVSSGQIRNCWIAARSQSAGRGRLGRTWQSPEGNLFATALFTQEGSFSGATKIPFLSGLAVADVFTNFAPQAAIQLKWPNDVRSEGRKVCGILVEAGVLDSGYWLACGIGINVSHTPENTGQPATCLAELRGDNVVTAEMVLEALRQAFQKRLSQLLGGFAVLRKDWLKLAEGLNSRVVIRMGNADVAGIFEDLGQDGELLLRLPDGTLRTITAGDVELVKERVE